MKWMLALDVGTNSLGWWAYEVTSKNKNGWTISSSIDGGVRLFPDGREPSSRGRVGDSLAVNRRTARGMRRNKEHRQVRIRKLGPVDNRACSFCCFLIQECKRGGFDEGRSFGPFR